jgi:hypothetical protein
MQESTFLNACGRQIPGMNGLKYEVIMHSERNKQLNNAA